MKKHTAILISLIVMCVVLMGCKTKDTPSESVRSEADSTATLEADPRISSTATLETDPRIAETEKDTSSGLNGDPTHLIWTVDISPYITENARREINGFLRRKGINCEIDFVDVELGAEYKEWYDKQKKNNSCPDIMAVAPWNRGIYDAVEFIRAELLPLNDYLDTVEGQKLLDSYCDVEWKQVSIDGKIYTTPKRTKERTYDLYIYINDHYKDTFEESFDGSYESLKLICEDSSLEHPIIAAYSMGVPLASSLLGYQYQNFLFYNRKRGIYDNLWGDYRLKDLLSDMYTDIETGRFVSWASPDILSEGVFAYITDQDLNESFAGYTQYVLSPYVFTINPGAFGVCAFSSKQEMALQVLNACFSDPEIASLIGYGEVNEEKWDKETEILKSHTDDKVTGFIPEISKVEIEQLYRAYLEMADFSGKMISSRDPVTGVGIVNPNFPSILEEYFATPKDYGEIYDKINRQLEEWTEKQKD